MGNLWPFADGMKYWHRSLLKVRCGCFDPVRFYNFSAASSCRGYGNGAVDDDDGFSSFYRWLSKFSRSSSLLGEGGSRSSSSRGFGEAALFPSRQRPFSSAPEAAVDVEGTPLPASSTLSSPLLLIPPSLLVHNNGDGRTMDDSESADASNDFYHVFSIAENKEMKINKAFFNWQRELLTPDDAICLGSSHGWLGFIDRRNCYPYLLNPLNASSYIPLPALETLPVVRGFTVGRSNFDSPTPSLTKRYIMFKDDTDLELHAIMTQYLNNLCLRNLVMSSSPPSSLNPFSSYSSSHYGGNNCTLMFMFGNHFLGVISKIAFCKAGDESWSVLDDYGLGRDYIQLAYFSKDQCFYAMDRDYSIEAIDLGNPTSPKITTVIDKPDPRPRNPSLSKKEQSLLLDHGYYKKATYLVESSGDLLLVLRFIGLNVSEDGTPRSVYSKVDLTSEEDDHFRNAYMLEYRTLKFEVYKLDFLQKRWEFVECLGDCALFVGFNQPFSLTTSDFPHLRTNSIYFTDGYHLETHGQLWNRSCRFHDNGVFNLEDGCITPFYQRSLKRIEPYYPPSSDLFEQPPIFVAPNKF